MSLVVRKPVFLFLTRSDANRVGKPKKIARGLKFQISDKEELYYLCSENEGADQQSR